ncbi:EamA family transporter [Roseinatronobacter alkalisoli]|uniref:DMT family transporter n=1 Tax=Roseinatronobacter alkalisoli TaxID=3028235 RepID=A0ABT5TA68_9RHOB|nr:DMT family transporter [Roseinatronobacter sp. HJB301]MDD7971964.1 DMT family transporter [Roseinatronobacter sp. HJB301]
MSWVGFGLLAGVILGLYDYWTKKAMSRNMVMTVVFWSALFGALAWLVAFLPIATGTGFHVRVSETNAKEQLLILIKGVMMTGSWVFAYYAVRELPMSFSGAMRASGPLWTMLGGIIVFQEFLSPVQFFVVIVAVLAYFLLSQIGKTEGIRLMRSVPVLMMLLATILSAMTTVYDKFIVHDIGISATTVQAWSAIHRFLLAGLLLAWVCRKNPTAWKPTWSIWIPLVGLSWVAAEWVYFLAINDPSASVTYLSVFRRASLIVGFMLSVMLIGERNVRPKSVVVGILFLSTAILAFQA